MPSHAMGRRGEFVTAAFLFAFSILAPTVVGAQSADTVPTAAGDVAPGASCEAVVTGGAVDVPPAVPVVRRVEPSAALSAPLKSVVKELRSGPLLIHGNFCGIGNRPGAAPIDALDAACMRHDACTRTGKLPSCACDDRLRVEAATIARDPRTTPDIQVVATATATAMAVLICKTGGTLAVPILPTPR